MNPFRFGASIAAARTADEWRETARRIEAWGYATLVVPDHLVAPFAPFPALAVAAEAAPSLRVGTMVAVNDFRHPAVLAKDAATLDFLTGGRVELGIGAGWHRGEFDAAGIPFADGADRVERLAESITIIKRLWGSEPVTFLGDHYRIDHLDGWPKPVQRPHPPIMIGGSMRGVLGLAARAADIVSLTPSFGPNPGRPNLESFTAAGVEKRIGWLRDAAPERMDALEICTYFAGRGAVTDEPRARAEAVLRKLADRIGRAASLGVDEALASPQFLFGSVEQIVDTLVERRERYGISYIVVADEMVEPFAPVARTLAGISR